MKAGHPDLFYIILTLLLIPSFIFWFLPDKKLIFPIINIAFDLNLFRNTSIFIFSLLLTEANYSRVKQQYDYWGKDFENIVYNSYFYIGYRTTDLPWKLPILTIVPKPGLPRIQNLLYYFFGGLEYFLTKTPSINWFWRTTEDTLINPLELPKFLEELDRKYDPVQDSVILGQSCEYSSLEPRSFIHGGAGWIMSRRAALDFYVDRNIYLDTLLSPEFIGIGDDVITDLYAQKHQLEARDLHSYRILSTPLDDFSVDTLLSKDYSKVPVCEPNPWEYATTRTHFPMKGLVAWHSGRRDVISIAEGFRILSSVPENIYIYYDRDHVSICLNESVKLNL